MGEHDRPPAGRIETDIPARLDRLPWSRWHWLLVLALGVTWILDGLEVTVVGAIGSVLEKPEALSLSDSQVGLAGTLYLAGAISGALFFGYLTDRLGRKRLFTVTLGIYLAAAALTALSWNFWSFILFRFLTGTAIGGEYAAINSAIDELIPARLRGKVDLAVNGSYWLGAAAGAAASVVLLNPTLIATWLGWRLAFALGALLGGIMIVARHYVPESPRWLLTHGRADEANAIMAEIETHVAGKAGPESLPPVNKRITINPGRRITLGTVIWTMLFRYRSRAFLGLVLIAAQAFFYNSIFFTYPLVLTKFYEVEGDRAGLYVLFFALGNFLGPLLLGGLFDRVGRKPMISATYTLSALLILLTGVLFINERLNADTQTLLWTVTFFFASAAASAAYLTVSEIFPLEMRALAIAVFYAFGTAAGGLVAPALLGALIETLQPEKVFLGYAIAAALMIVAAAVELLFGVATERRSLEDVAAPLSSEESGESPQPASLSSGRA